MFQKTTTGLQGMAATKEVQDALRGMGYQPPSAMSPAQMDQLIRSDTDAWGAVIRKAGIKAD